MSQHIVTSYINTCIYVTSNINTSMQFYNSHIIHNVYRKVNDKYIIIYTHQTCIQQKLVHEQVKNKNNKNTNKDLTIIWKDLYDIL